jgi:hypothetical protein
LSPLLPPRHLLPVLQQVPTQTPDKSVSMIKSRVSSVTIISSKISGKTVRRVPPLPFLAPFLAPQDQPFAAPCPLTLAFGQPVLEGE